MRHRKCDTLFTFSSMFEIIEFPIYSEELLRLVITVATAIAIVESDDFPEKFEMVIGPNTTAKYVYKKTGSFSTFWLRMLSVPGQIIEIDCSLLFYSPPGEDCHSNTFYVKNKRGDFIDYCGFRTVKFSSESSPIHPPFVTIGKWIRCIVHHRQNRQNLIFFFSKTQLPNTTTTLAWVHLRAR